MNKVPTTTVGNLIISRVINGLWQLADMEREGRPLNPQVVVSALQAYQAAGFFTYDMADHYGSSEMIAGLLRETVAKRGDQVRLLTKWVPDFTSTTKAEVANAIHAARNKMRVPQIDLMQYHAWNYSHPIWLDHLFWIDELRQEGLVANIGLTNFDHHHLALALESGIPICTNQISLSLLDLRATRDMCRLCLNYGVGILAFGTLAGGFLSNRWLGKTEPDWDQLETWSQMKYFRYLSQLGGWDYLQALLALLDRISQAQNATIAQIAAKYILDLPGVAAIIIGVRPGRSEHIDETLALFNVTIPPESRREIEQFTGAKTLPGHCGDEYRYPPFLTAKGDLSDHISDMPLPYPIQEDRKGRIRCLSGVAWEDLAGYCRAIKIGDRIIVSGTTATHGSRVIGGKDPAAQTHFIIDKIAGALQSFGADLADVIKTRVYIRHQSDWEPIARAHGERFRDIKPANTLVVASLIGDEYLVEIEAEAIC